MDLKRFPASLKCTSNYITYVKTINPKCGQKSKCGSGSGSGLFTWSAKKYNCLSMTPLQSKLQTELPQLLQLMNFEFNNIISLKLC